MLKEKISDEKIYDLIFHPGFSTADQVSDISGRGVVMDVSIRDELGVLASPTDGQARDPRVEPIGRAHPVRCQHHVRERDVRHEHGEDDTTSEDPHR